MKVRASRNVKVLSVSILLSSAMIAGGIAYAAGDTITACVKKSNGTTRIISGKMKCTKTERQVSWGSTGEQGPAGATGATGAQGPAGAVGVTGASGTNGISNIYTKTVNSTSIPYNYPLAPISAVIPAGKYNFQVSGQLSYFNNNVSFNSTRYLGCLLTTHFDSPTAFSNPHASSVLWPKAGAADVFRTSFAPAAATTSEVDMQAYSISGTIDMASDATIYLQCLNETPGGGSSGQESIFHYLNITLVRTDQITSIS